MKMMKKTGKAPALLDVVTVKAHDGIPEGTRTKVVSSFPYLGYMVKEGYWKIIK